jgi:hypothetical protein
MKKRPQTLSFVVEDCGDGAVGIWPFHEEITVTLEYGDHCKDILEMLERDLKELFKESFEECKCRCLTATEYQAEREKQALAAHDFERADDLTEQNS